MKRLLDLLSKLIINATAMPIMIIVDYYQKQKNNLETLTRNKKANI